jgi:3-oxoacyl-[acyl-carrier-protein] synthase-1
MKKVYITNHNIISSLGFDSASNFNNLLKQKSGIRKYFRKNGDPFYGSLIDKDKLNNAFSRVGDVEKFTSLEKLMILSVQNVLEESEFKITGKTGLIIASTKGNIDAILPDSEFYHSKNRVYLPELGKRVQDFFGFANEPVILSNACVSGVLSLAVAKRLIQSQVYQDIIVVAGDLVTEFILSGFISFQSISNEPCKPYSRNRSGITLGEAAACALLTSDEKYFNDQTVRIIGDASANDANHISGPSRTGEGLFRSVKSAMKEAESGPDKIDFISAHGTATIYNDEMEAFAFNRLKMSKIPLNSLKGYYGHTLGASGLLESVIGIESLFANTLVPSMGFDELGVSIPLNIIQDVEKKDVNLFLKTASGFGGSNTAVIFEKLLIN